jgi:hypothetical protein
VSSKITVGADPEMFLVSADGNLCSAIDRIGGHKENPRPLGREGFFVQEDNVAVEFNIPPASECSAFVESIHWAKRKIEEEVSVYGMKPSSIAAALFPAVELTDPRALTFGCDPDFNAWKKGKRNPKPRASNLRLRSCGGHIHIGFPKKDIHTLRLIQLMDLYLGVPSVMMDEDTMRRELYGKAGCFRDQAYGVEYRTLSNFWLRDQATTAWAFDQTLRAVAKAAEFGLPKNRNGRPDDYSKFMETHDLGDEIQACINNSSPELAQKLIANHDLKLA